MIFPIRTRLLLCITLLVGPGAVWAQRENPLNPQIGSTRQDSVPSGIMPLDTPVPMRYVLISDPDRVYSISDTLITSAYQHTPLKFFEAHLGNYGSATRSLVPGGPMPIGYATGWFQYHPYFVHDAAFRYYHQDIPVAKIRFSQASQENTNLELDFGRSFASGLSLSVTYKRINQIGEFFNQRQKNTGLGFGVWHNAPSGKYDAFYNFISNAAIAQENGGITTDTVIGQNLFPDINVPTRITSGLTEQKHRIFVTRHVLHLTGDSSDIGIDLWLKGKWASGLYKFVDTEAADFISFYTSAYLFDDRGIRQFTFDREHEWSAGVALPWKAAHSTIDVSIRYRNIRVEQEPAIRKINELYLDASGFFQWVEPLILRGDVSIGLGRAEGAFSFKATGELKAGVLGAFRGHWMIHSRRPYLVESSLYVNQQSVYSHTWRNPLVNEVGVEWHIEKQDFRAGITWMVHDNFIYFDLLPQPRQLGESFSIRRFHIAKGFDFRWVALQGQVIWQPDIRSELALPGLLYTANLFGRINLFEKKVTLVPGMHLTYHDGYNGVRYFPVTGTYHLTAGPAIPDYMRIDAGLAMQIRFLKVYVRMDDIVGQIKNRVLWQADLYPHFRGYFRLGLEAGFFN